MQAAKDAQVLKDTAIVEAEKANAAAMQPTLDAYAEGVKIADKANKKAHKMSGGMTTQKYPPKAAIGGGDSGFNNSIAVGTIAGVAGVLAAYFILKKLLNRNKSTSDDFSRMI